MTASIKLKTAVFAPMPNPRISTAVIVKPGDFSRMRMIWWRWRVKSTVKSER